MRTIEEIKESKGYKDALDAPSFSLGFDDVTQKSPSKSTADDSITSSMFDQLCDDAMKKISEASRSPHHKHKLFEPATRNHIQ